MPIFLGLSFLAFVACFFVPNVWAFTLSQTNQNEVKWQTCYHSIDVVMRSASDDVATSSGLKKCKPKDMVDTQAFVQDIETLLPRVTGKTDPVNAKKHDKDQIEDVSSDDFFYKTGIPTLRSSAHRVKSSLKHRHTNENRGQCLPSLVCQPLVLDYDTSKYDFQTVLLKVLEECKTQIIGHCSSSATKRLEEWRVPYQSVTRKYHGGACEDSQAYLSEQLATNKEFLTLFDNFVENIVLQHLKQQLLSLRQEDESAMKSTTFYYQRPPTLRLQPGPAQAHVKMHNDAQYGHQDGEVNFWIPLTDRNLTKVDLHLQEADSTCTPIPVAVGQVFQFHGTRVNHYVNSNITPYTRVSMDFRVGVEGYFDPQWAMVGTTADHSRRKVQV